VRSFGAEPIDYHTQGFVEYVQGKTDGGADVVFDPVGGSRQLRRSFKATRPGGKLAWFGMAVTKTRGLKAILGTLVARGLLGIMPRGRQIVDTPDLAKEVAWYRQLLPELFDLLKEGKVSPVVAARIPLVEAVRAHEILESGEYGGKVVLVAE
jgi:NADPH:quinone reductase-like Zn-dependent oxidoreductase